MMGWVDKTAQIQIICSVPKVVDDCVEKRLHFILSIFYDAPLHFPCLYG